MRLSLFILVACLLSGLAHAQTNLAFLQKADDLVAQRKYESAFRYLQEKDPKNQQLAMVLKKAEVALNYNLTTRQYLTFTFRDLALTDNLDEMREHADSLAVGATRYRFHIRAALDSLKKRYPDNYKIDRGLGDYYFSVQQCDCAERKIVEDDLFPLIINYYKTAHAHGYGDYFSYFATGYAYQRLGQFRQAVGPFQHSIELRKDYPISHLNLAFVLLELKQFDKARAEAKIACEQFQDEQFKSDAAFLLSEIENRIKGLAAKTPVRPSTTTRRRVATPAKTAAPSSTTAKEKPAGSATGTDLAPQARR